MCLSKTLARIIKDTRLKVWCFRGCSMNGEAELLQLGLRYLPRSFHAYLCTHVRRCLVFRKTREVHVETRTSDEPEPSERARKAQQNVFSPVHQAYASQVDDVSLPCLAVNDLCEMRHGKGRAFQGMERKRMVPFTRLGFSHQGRPEPKPRRLSSPASIFVRV